MSRETIITNFNDFLTYSTPLKMDKLSLPPSPAFLLLSSYGYQRRIKFIGIYYIHALFYWQMSEKGIVRLLGHKGRINQVTFMKTKNILISGGKDCCIKFFDLDTNHCFKTISPFKSEVSLIEIFLAYTIVAFVSILCKNQLELIK